MNKLVLTIDLQNYIKENIDADIMALLLGKPIFEGVSNKEVVEQLVAKKKCQGKLPTWYHKDHIYYPAKINIEQTSSEETAAYKAEIVQGASLLDITGGFGVDSFYFSKKMKSVLHCEIDPKLSEIACHNFQVLNLKNIKCLPIDGIQFLETCDNCFDWIYLDPSRRNDAKGKVFQLEDCTPNISVHLDLLFSKSKNIMMKTSPLLDLTRGMSQLRSVKEIHIISIGNEVKELLWILEYGYSEEVLVKTVDLGKTSRASFEFYLNVEKSSVPSYSSPLNYLYEPNAAILKSGGFKNIGRYYGVFKLHEHTHLYTSEELIEFPGRRFKIDKTFLYKDKAIKQEGLKKANITVRNFPLTVEQIRKKHRIRDGGTDYLFFCILENNSLVVIMCSKC